MSARVRAAASLLVLLVLLPASLAGCATVTVEGEESERTPFTVTDDQKRQVTLSGPVRRAVVINSYGNEFVRAVGAGDTVVGVDRASLDRLPYLPVDRSHVVAEGLDQLNYEAIAQLRPDVVVMPRNAVWQEASTQLAHFGIPVVVATAWDADNVDHTIELLGQVFGRQDGAKQVLAFRREITGLLSQRLAGVAKTPLYFETVEPYLTVLPGSGFQSMIDAAGGANVFADARGGDGQDELTVDPAQVVLRRPQFVMHELAPSVQPQRVFARMRAQMAARPGWSTMPAVRGGRVAVANGWATSALGKTIGALYLATWLHPERMKGVDADAYLKRWVTQFQRTTFTRAADYVEGPTS